MPIEIRELHIKAIVGAQESSEQTKVTDRGGDEKELEPLIAICVERVLEILEAKAER